MVEKEARKIRPFSAFPHVHNTKAHHAFLVQPERTPHHIHINTPVVEAGAHRVAIPSIRTPPTVDLAQPGDVLFVTSWATRREIVITRRTVESHAGIAKSLGTRRKTVTANIATPAKFHLPTPSPLLLAREPADTSSGFPRSADPELTSTWIRALLSTSLTSDGCFATLKNSNQVPDGWAVSATSVPTSLDKATSTF